MRREFECGTYAAVQAHRRRGETVDDACKAAATTYMRQHRKKNPKAYQRERAANNARERALWRLAAAHRAEFQRLTLEEMDRGDARRPAS